MISDDTKIVKTLPSLELSSRIPFSVRSSGLSGVSCKSCNDIGSIDKLEEIKYSQER